MTFQIPYRYQAKKPMREYRKTQKSRQLIEIDNTNDEIQHYDVHSLQQLGFISFAFKP